MGVAGGNCFRQILALERNSAVYRNALFFLVYVIEKHPMTVVYEQKITKKVLLMRKR